MGKGNRGRAGSAGASRPRSRSKVTRSSAPMKRTAPPMAPPFRAIHSVAAIGEALAESEQQMRLRRSFQSGRAGRVLDSVLANTQSGTPLLITTAPPTLCIVFANSPMLDMLGVRGADVFGLDVRQFFEDDEAFRCQVVASGKGRPHTGQAFLRSGPYNTPRKRVSLATRPLVSAKVPNLRDLCASHVEWSISGLARVDDLALTAAPEPFSPTLGATRRHPAEEEFPSQRARWERLCTSLMTCVTANAPMAPPALRGGALTLQLACSMTFAHLCLYMLASPDALVLTDFRGRIMLVNYPWEQLCGYSLREVQGHTSAFLQAEETDQNVTNNFMLALTKGVPACMVVENQKKNRQHFANKVEAYPFFGELEPLPQPGAEGTSSRSVSGYSSSSSGSSHADSKPPAPCTLLPLPAFGGMPGGGMLGGGMPGSCFPGMPATAPPAMPFAPPTAPMGIAMPVPKAFLARLSDFHAIPAS